MVWLIVCVQPQRRSCSAPSEAREAGLTARLVLLLLPASRRARDTQANHHPSNVIQATTLFFPPSSCLSMSASAGASRGPKYSVLLPTYNERQNLPLMVEMLVTAFTDKSAQKRVAQRRAVHPSLRFAR